MKPYLINKSFALKKLLFLLLIIILFISLAACDSTKALNIQGDGTSVEKDMQQEIASTQRDYQPKSLEQNKNTNPN